VVVDGAARDIDKARGIGFPVFARAAVASTARGRVAEYATNAPIVVGGVTVKPGDMVIAGGSGAVFIKAERAAEGDRGGAGHCRPRSRHGGGRRRAGHQGAGAQLRSDAGPQEIAGREIYHI